MGPAGGMNCRNVEPFSGTNWKGCSMVSTIDHRLAIDGGTPAVSSPTPKRRRFDLIEREALLQALENENLFRYLREDESQVRVFERDFAATIGAKHALAVSSGTAALICALVGA